VSQGVPSAHRELLPKRRLRPIWISDSSKGSEVTIAPGAITTEDCPSKWTSVSVDGSMRCSPAEVAQ
jgi:hypothetical protein